MSRASEDLLDLIHNLTATSLADELKRAAFAAAQPKTIMVEGAPQPNPAYAALNPQLIDKARAFLKDNGVDTAEKSPRVDNLANQLHDLDLDDEAVRLRPN